MRKPTRPAPLSLGSYTVRAMGQGPDAEGRWLYRLEWYPPGGGGAQETRGLGRLDARDVEARGHAAIAALGAATAPAGPVATWSVLLRAALAAWRREGAATGRPQPRTLESYALVVSHLLGAAEVWPIPSGALALGRQARELRDRLLRRADRPGLAPSTTRLALTVAGMAWQWGVREELVPPLRWESPRLDVPRTERHIPTREDALRVLAELRRREGDGWPVAAYLLDWATAPRIGELAALTLADWLPAEGVVWYGRHPGASKTGPRAAVVDPGTVAAVEAMLEARREAGEVLDADTRIWPVAAVTVRSLYAEHVYRAMDAAGVTRWASHTVRSAVADALTEAGVDSVSQSAQLGNTEEVRRRHYRSALDARRRLATAAISLAEQPAVEGGDVLPMRRRS